MKAWIAAARLRTLPLSLSGILVAGGIAANQGVFNWTIFALAMATTLGFQILSNFANDYGDGVKGTDTEDRVGPARALQSGLLTADQLKRGMWVMSGYAALMAGWLILISFDRSEWVLVLIYALLGGAAIVAAIRYTVGQGAYGYKGFGDVFVFLFFGLIGVAGAQYLFTRSIGPEAVMLSVTIGFLSMAVLNLNNMRDRQTDAGSGKRTLAVKLGRGRSMAYHFLLIVIAIVAATWVLLERMNQVWDLLPLLALIPLLPHLFRVWRHRDPASLDPELKKVALSTFFFSVLVFVWPFFN